MTRVTWVCVGTGGVGKTTIAAALATAIAATGRTTVVATVDPARRLGHTLGLPGLGTRTAVPGVPNLSALAPDAATDVHALVERWLAAKPVHEAGLANNPLLAALGNGFAGIHELVSLVALADLGNDATRPCEALVIDTAPSRHGLDLLALPARLAEVIDGRALAWAGELAKVTPRPGLRSRLTRWGQRRLVSALTLAAGEVSATAAFSLLAFAADMRPELSRLAADAGALLAPAAVRIALVTAARPGAVDEVEQMRAALSSPADTHLRSSSSIAPRRARPARSRRCRAHRPSCARSRRVRLRSSMPHASPRTPSPRARVRSGEVRRSRSRRCRPTTRARSSPRSRA